MPVNEKLEVGLSAYACVFPLRGKHAPKVQSAE